MSIREREGLISRIRQIRRAADTTDEPRRAAASPERGDLHALEVRVAHLEHLLQGLQDSVHRESMRTDNRIAELEAQIDPAALGRALSDDARNRGL
jgi:uncharacterized coiled-coil protein SlyX